MKRFLIDTLLAAFICAVLLFIWQAIASITGYFIPLEKRDSYKIGQAVIIVFCISVLGYKRLWSKQTLKKPTHGFAFLVFHALLIFIVFHLVSIHKNTIAYYRYFNASNFKAWKGKMYLRDSLLGYKLAPALSSQMLYSQMPAIDVFTNSGGFRIGAGEKKEDLPTPETDILFLGCSFTFGSVCNAEETFPYIVSQKKQYRYINAGVEGYGLAQMILTAKELLPKYHPRIVVIQYSPWLAYRSTFEFAPSHGGYLLPVPYFSKQRNSYEIEPPIYRSSVEQLFPDQDRQKYQGHFLKYYFQKGFLYYAGEQLKIMKHQLRYIIGNTASPTRNIKGAEAYGYAQLLHLIESYNARAVILKLNNGPVQESSDTILRRPNLLVANADSLMLRELDTINTDAYNRKFGHWAKKDSDSVMVDGHPNKLAHKIIAEAIVKLLQ